MSELEFCTTQELIDELMRRRTFLGVVVQADGDHRGGGWDDEKLFRVRFNENLSPEEVARLLGVIAGHLEREADG